VRLRQRREDIINMYLKEVPVKVWTGIGWLRMGSSGKFFRAYRRTFGFHKGQGIS
jgi:hypothetical protein